MHTTGSAGSRLPASTATGNAARVNTRRTVSADRHTRPRHTETSSTTIPGRRSVVSRTRTTATTGDQQVRATNRDHRATATTGTVMALRRIRARPTTPNTTSERIRAATTDTARIRLQRQHTERGVDRRTSGTPTTSRSDRHRRTTRTATRGSPHRTRPVRHLTRRDRTGRRRRKHARTGRRIGRHRVGAERQHDHRAGKDAARQHVVHPSRSAAASTDPRLPQLHTTLIGTSTHP